MQQLPHALAPLANFKQWVLWIARPDPNRPGKTNKFPFDPYTGKVVSAHDPAAWLTFDTASQILPQSVAQGVGFVFTDQDPFFFIDVDNAFDNGQWSQTATSLCQQFAGAAIEVSHSGKGLHIIGTCDQRPHGTRCQALGLELYTKLRFVALTGNDAQGNAFNNCQASFDHIVQNYFPPREHAISEDWTESPCLGWNGHTDDDELIKHAVNSTSAGSAFGSKASFADLWSGNEPVLSQAFPTNNDVDPWGRSEAEAALCSHLAFWTGRNCERIDRLFRVSGLMRDKWERADYARSTILLSCTGDGDVYTLGGSSESDILPGADTNGQGLGGGNTGNQLAPAGGVNNTAPGPSGPQTPGNATQATETSIPGSANIEYSQYSTFICTTELLEYFKGCVYVSEDHAVLVPGGTLLNQGRFKAQYGGAVFSLDTIGNKQTRNAWEAFTENISLRFPKVETTMFAPELPPGEIRDLQGTLAVNTYWPVKVNRKAGDASLFVKHIYNLLPEGDDARILLTYLAALVQNPGHKFQWCPVIQGPEGNGKTVLIEAISNAVGERYTHLPNAADLGGNGSKFNAWIRRKLFIGVEEIYCADRREVMELLKDKITNRRIEIQGKGDNQITGDNRTNWLMMTNHKDAIPVTVDSRRYCIFYCAQQSADELLKAGLDAHYFKRLWDWLRKEDGFAIVTNFLLDYQCEAAFDPSENGLAMRAPKTTSSTEAVTLSGGLIEQEIAEAIGQGRAGFCYPWISSVALDGLLKEIRRSLTYAKRPEVLRSLGYEMHPGLKDGRVNNPTATDGMKTRLFCVIGHLVNNLTGPAAISKMYDDDQNVLPSAAAIAFQDTK